MFLRPPPDQATMQKIIEEEGVEGLQRWMSEQVYPPNIFVSTNYALCFL